MAFTGAHRPGWKKPGPFLTEVLNIETCLGPGGCSHETHPQKDSCTCQDDYICPFHHLWESFKVVYPIDPFKNERLLTNGSRDT